MNFFRLFNWNALTRIPFAAVSADFGLSRGLSKIKGIRMLKMLKVFKMFMVIKVPKNKMLAMAIKSGKVV